MTFLISNTFTDSFGHLSGDEQKAVKTTVFDLQVNPDSPGLGVHKLDKARDKNFMSVRVNADIRIIVHKTAGSILLCYVDHHNKAYEWAERRKLETHPNTGAAQLVEIRETVKEIELPVYVDAPVRTIPKPLLFADASDAVLLGYGVPYEWLSDVRLVDEDGLLALATRLPAEAAEALLELATGGKPRVAQASPSARPFEHPDAQRRFRVMQSVEELERALEYPWDQWSIFLHPEQRQLVDADFAGPAKVSGSAGTGKTIVALHRAVHLAIANPDARIVLATFSEILANSLRIKLRRLLGSDPRLAERIDVCDLKSLGTRLYRSLHGNARFPSNEVLRGLLAKASGSGAEHKFSLHFLTSEWEQVVDAWQIDSWEAYRDVPRLGRKTRLNEIQRKKLWDIFEIVRVGLKDLGLITLSGVFTALARDVKGMSKPPYDFAVVDEAQDLSVSQLRFFAALGGGRGNALFFAGDLGQRIFQQPFSWKSLGVEIRGRASNLRVNYRTSHQIREQADRLLGGAIADIDGNEETRDDTISVFNGPAPDIRVLEDEDSEREAVAAWLTDRIEDGVQPHEVGVFVRSSAQFSRAQRVLESVDLPFKVLDEHVDVTSGQAVIASMHLAKGLEFRAVAVMACDDEVLPLQERIESVGDDADLQEVYDTERHLLYVACTRARDYLLITGTEPASEFLADLGQKA